MPPLPGFLFRWEVAPSVDTPGGLMTPFGLSARLHLRQRISATSAAGSSPLRALRVGWLSSIREGAGLVVVDWSSTTSELVEDEVE